MSENLLEFVKKGEFEEAEFKKGIIVGLKVSDQTLKSISQKIRQRIKYVKEKGSISNKECCNLLKVSRKTATTDLIDLVNKEIFSPFGTSKRVLRYEFKLRKNYAKRGVK